MNHNFADWNTTILFDNTNIENRCNNYNHTIYIVIDKNKNEYIVILNDDACYSIDEYVKNYGYTDSRRAISWEDIRLYLKDKGFELKISPYVDNYDNDNADDFQILYYYDVIFVNTGEVEPDNTYYHTYEEARREAIKYCLSLIKESNG